jgi:hypothetical protein
MRVGMACADHVVKKSLSIPITFVENVEKRMTSQTQCKGSDKQVVKWEENKCKEAYCPVCDTKVSIRFATLPPTETRSGLKMSSGGMWVAMPHEKPFASRCADCGTGLYVSDYLCKRCRRASLAE